MYNKQARSYASPENTNLKGKYHRTADLFILFGFRCFAYVE